MSNGNAFMQVGTGNFSVNNYQLSINNKWSSVYYIQEIASLRSQ